MNTEIKKDPKLSKDQVASLQNAAKCGAAIASTLKNRK